MKFSIERFAFFCSQYECIGKKHPIETMRRKLYIQFHIQVPKNMHAVRNCLMVIFVYITS